MLDASETVQSQYAASPTIRALVDGFNAGVDPRSDIKLFYDRIFNPSTAQGIGLDIWARIVGVERNVYVEEIEKNFGFFINSPPVPQTYPIPSAIRALPGYGWSAGTAYNYVDFTRKVYVQSVTSIDLGTATWIKGNKTFLTYYGVPGIKKAESNDDVGNMLCAIYAADSYNNVSGQIQDKIISVQAASTTVNIYDAEKLSTLSAEEFKASLDGVLLYYELATPIETDIAWIIDGIELPVEPNTVIAFPNANGADYKIPVPSEISYTVDDETVTDDTVAYSKTVSSSDVTIEKIGGRSIVWNQILRNGNFANGTTGFEAVRCVLSASDNIMNAVVNTASNLSRFIQRLSFPFEHKFFFSVYVKPPKDTAFQVSVRNNSQSGYYVNGVSHSVTAGTWNHCEDIITATKKAYAFNSAWFMFGTSSDTEVGDAYQFKDLQIFDLTVMFGAGNEPSTVEEVTAMFPASYYDYNTGEIISAPVTGINYTVGNGRWQDWTPWDQGVFYSPEKVKTGLYRIDDNALRKFIFWKALANISTSDCYTLNRLLSKLFNSPVFIEEDGLMHIRVVTTAKLEDWQKAVLAQYGMFGKPAGVGYEFWTIEMPVLGMVTDANNYQPLGQATFFNGVIDKDFGGN